MPSPSANCSHEARKDPRHHILPTGVLGLAADRACAQLFAACMDGHVYAVDAATGVSSGLRRATRQLRLAAVSFCRMARRSFPAATMACSSGMMWPVSPKCGGSRRTVLVLAARAFPGWHAASPAARAISRRRWKYEPAAAEEPTVKVFDTRTGDLRDCFSARPPVLSCAFSPDGTHLAAANMMGEVQRLESDHGGDRRGSFKPRNLPAGESSKARTTAAASMAWPLRRTANRCFVPAWAR